MARIRSIKPEFEAALIGFFLGEGHVDLVRQGKTTRALSVRIRIALRSDDAAILEQFKSVWGGSLYARQETRSVCWQLTGKDRVTDFLNAASKSELNSKKKQEILLALESANLTSHRGGPHPTEDGVKRMFEIRDALKALRQFNGGAQCRA